MDSVDEIVMTTSDKVSSDANLGFSFSGNTSPNDTAGVLTLTGKDSEESLVMIMSIETLISKCITESQGTEAALEFN